MMKQLITIKCESDKYHITLNPGFFDKLRKKSIYKLIIFIIEISLTVLMEIELFRIFNLNKGDHSKERTNTRNGTYKRTWHTIIGEITLEIPKLRYGSYAPFFIPALDYLSEMRAKLAVFVYVAGLTTRLIAPLFSNLGIKPMQKSTVSINNKKYLDEEITSFNQIDFSGLDCPIIMIDALYEDVRFGAFMQKAAVIVVTGIDSKGFRRLLNIAVTTSECPQTYKSILSDLKKRGLKSPELILSDAHTGIRQAIRNTFPGCLWQRCTVHTIRYTLNKVSKANKLAFYSMMRRCYTAKNRKESEDWLQKLIKNFSETEPLAVRAFQKAAQDTFTFHEFPMIDFTKIYSTNIHERLNRTIRSRTRASVQFPDEASYRRLVISWLLFFRHAWNQERYLDPEQMSALRETGKKRRKALEEEMGAIRINPINNLPKTNTVHISYDPYLIHKDGVTNQVIAILVGVPFLNDSEQIIDYTLLNGIDDIKKLNRIVRKIKSYLDSEDYLIIMEYGNPDLERIFQNAFGCEHIQYCLNSFPAGILAHIPKRAKKSVEEILKILNHKESQKTVQLAIKSLTQLWSINLPKASEFLKEKQLNLFNFLRFTDFKCSSAASLQGIDLIRNWINSAFSRAAATKSFTNFNVEICNYINQINKTNWILEIKRINRILRVNEFNQIGSINQVIEKKTCPRKRSHRKIKSLKVDDIRPPRITEEMDRKCEELLKNSHNRKSFH